MRNQLLQNQDRLLLKACAHARVLQIPRVGVQNPSIEADFLDAH
jgi:hypothetical protein